MTDETPDAMPSNNPADDESLALTAAAASLALGAAGVIEPLPPALRARLEADAVRHFQAQAEFARRAGTPPNAWKAAACVGWLAAAASWLAMAMLPGFTPRPPDDRPGRVGPAAWIAPLKVSDHPLASGARGQVAWDQASQSGELRLQGLAGADPRKGVYQLWIFDAGRDPRYPIDGGTFTVADASASTTIPVRPMLPVGRPSLFAITLEPPGGVVVSDRQRIMLSASYP